MEKKKAKILGPKTGVIDKLCKINKIEKWKSEEFHCLNLSSKDDRYVLRLTREGTKTSFILKGFMIENLKKNDQESSQIFEMFTYALRKFYLSKVASEISPHFPKVIVMDRKDHEKEYITYVEMIEEYCGETLNKVDSSPKIEIIYNWMLQSAVAMTALHSAGIAHMDIKYLNMTYNEEKDLLKMIDLGSSKEYAEQRNMLNVTSSFRAIECTHIFTPPEMYDSINKGGKVPLEDKNYIVGKVDIYCWAISFYLLFDGRPKQKELTQNRKKYDQADPKQYQTFLKILEDKIMENKFFDRKLLIQEFLKKIILKCLSFDPKERPEFKEVAEEMLNFAEEKKLCEKYRIDYLENKMNPNFFDQKKVNNLNNDIKKLKSENEEQKTKILILEEKCEELKKFNDKLRERKDKLMVKNKKLKEDLKEQKELSIEDLDKQKNKWKNRLKRNKEKFKDELETQRKNLDQTINDCINQTKKKYGELYEKLRRNKEKVKNIKTEFINMKKSVFDMMAFMKQKIEISIQNTVRFKEVLKNCINNERQKVYSGLLSSVRKYIYLSGFNKDEVDLTNQGISDLDCAIIAEAVKSNHKITTLRLSENKISDIGASHLAELIKANPSLIRLYVSDNLLQKQGIEMLIDAFETNKHYIKLEVNKNKLLEDDARTLKSKLLLDKNIKVSM